MKTIIKFCIACTLAGCIFPMPCVYFDFVLIASCAAFFWLAISEFKEGNRMVGIACAVAGILYNPIVRVNFNRTIWNDIDMPLAIILLLWVTIDIFFNPNGKIDYEL